jgi:exportin-2 (importin alpha re-exporter)
MVKQLAITFLTPSYLVAVRWSRVIFLATAESVLQEASKRPGHLLEVLQLVDNAQVNEAVRQAAAVHFKNLVKAAWDESRDAEDRKGIVVSAQDRTTIKMHLVELMCTVPPRIQSQVSESISLIAEVDYPQNWSNLLPGLIGKFTSPDINVVNGVLRTADSIFKRFRHVQRNDTLYAVIIYTLNLIQEPLLALFVQTSRQVEGLANDVGQLTPRFESLRLMARIYFSLVFQDLPEFMEDHMNDWMGEFAKYLQYNSPLLVDEDEDDDPGPIDKLQTAILSSLKLFVERDEEPFQPLLPDFVRLVWNLLVGLTSRPKHDQLVVSSIKFLSILVGRQIYGELFRDDATLREIVSRIVIPNMMVRESDEDNFNDNPEEFIMTELEGSDNESRRRCSRELLGAMCRQFEAQTTGICSEHITRMIGDFTSDNSRWIAKDTAVRKRRQVSHVFPHFISIPK